MIESIEIYVMLIAPLIILAVVIAMILSSGYRARAKEVRDYKKEVEVMNGMVEKWRDRGIDIDFLDKH